MAKIPTLKLIDILHKYPKSTTEDLLALYDEFRKLKKGHNQSVAFISMGSIERKKNLVLALKNRERKEKLQKLNDNEKEM